MLHLRITNTKRSYRSLMFNIPKTFEAFVSQYVKTHYPKWKDSDKIDRLERSYRVINKQGVKAIAVVNPDTGETIEKPCITIEELFSTIISDKIAEKIPDISEGCSSQMGFTLLLHEITHAQMFKPEEYLAYVLKRALEQRLPLNYEDAFNQFAQNIPEHCEHVAERKKDRNDTRCSCYKNYYAIIGKTGFKIR